MTRGPMELAVSSLQPEQQEEEEMPHDDLVMSSLQQFGIMMAQVVSANSLFSFCHFVIVSSHVGITFPKHVMLIVARTPTID